MKIDQTEKVFEINHHLMKREICGFLKESHYKQTNRSIEGFGPGKWNVAESEINIF